MVTSRKSDFDLILHLFCLFITCSSTMLLFNHSLRSLRNCICALSLCAQPCFSRSAWPSPLSVSAAWVPPTTWQSCCPGTCRARVPGNTAPAQEISNASTWGECGTFKRTTCLKSCVCCQVNDSVRINQWYLSFTYMSLTGEGPCALKERTPVKRTWQTACTQR